MKVLVLLQILAFLAVSVNADSICIVTKHFKPEYCVDFQGYKLSDFDFINDGDYLKICFTKSSKNTSDRECIENLTIKKSDILEIDITCQTFCHENNVTE